MSPRYAGPEFGMNIEDTRAYVKRIAVEILLGDGLVGRLVIVVVVGDLNLGPVEALVHET